MNTAELIERNGYEDVVIFNQPAYDTALPGISHDNRAVYSYEKMVQCLVDNNGLSAEQAIEFIEYNTIRSLPYVDGAPIVVYSLEE